MLLGRPPSSYRRAPERRPTRSTYELSGAVRARVPERAGAAGTEGAVIGTQVRLGKELEGGVAPLASIAVVHVSADGAAAYLGSGHRRAQMRATALNRSDEGVRSLGTLLWVPRWNDPTESPIQFLVRETRRLELLRTRSTGMDPADLRHCDPDPICEERGDRRIRRAGFGGRTARDDPARAPGVPRECLFGAPRPSPNPDLTHLPSREGRTSPRGKEPSARGSAISAPVRGSSAAQRVGAVAPGECFAGFCVVRVLRGGRAEEKTCI